MKTAAHVTAVAAAVDVAVAAGRRKVGIMAERMMEENWQLRQRRRRTMSNGGTCCREACRRSAPFCRWLQLGLVGIFGGDWMLRRLKRKGMLG